MSGRVLVVDDVATNRLLLRAKLSSAYYDVVVAENGQQALDMARSEQPDMVMLDVMMPEMDGYDVIGQLKGDPKTAEIPVIFVTAMDSTEDEERGLDHGAVDYITKPLRPAIVRARVRTHLELKRAKSYLQNQNLYLEAEVARRMRQNQIIQEVSIHALARLAETRDPETGNHLIGTRTPHVLGALINDRDFNRWREFPERAGKIKACKPTASDDHPRNPAGC